MNAGEDRVGTLAAASRQRLFASSQVFPKRVSAELARGTWGPRAGECGTSAGEFDKGGLARLTIDDPSWALTPGQLAAILGRKKVSHLTETHLSPMVADGVLERIYPDNPQHPRQAYRRVQPQEDA